MQQQLEAALQLPLVVDHRKGASGAALPEAAWGLRPAAAQRSVSDEEGDHQWSAAVRRVLKALLQLAAREAATARLQALAE